MRASRATGAITAFVALFACAPASAQDNILNDFRRNGSINPCQYSDGQLRRGLQNLPPDIQQYAPGLADQLAAGREGCGAGGGGGSQPAEEPAEGAPSGGGGGPAPSAPEPVVKVPAPPAPKAQARSRLADIATPTVTTAAATGSDTPAWLAPLLGVLALLGIVVALVRFGGWGPERFTRPIGAAFADLGGRTADAFTELRESVRLGR